MCRKGDQEKIEIFHNSFSDQHDATNEYGPIS